MNDLFKFEGLFLLINYYSERLDQFSPSDVQAICDNFTCRKRYIFKLWFNGLKHVFMQQFELPKKEAKKVRNELKDLVWDCYKFPLEWEFFFNVINIVFIKKICTYINYL